MSSFKKTLLVLFALAWVAAPAAKADWLHYADTLLQATEEIEKHPASASHTIFIQKAIESPVACVGYSNSLAKKNQGRLVVDVLVLRADGTEETKKLFPSVKKNSALSCKALEVDLEVGDAVHFDIDFRGFPRLRNNDSRFDFAEVSAMVSAIGEPTLGQDAPLGFVPAKGGAPFGIRPEQESGRYRAARSVFQVDDDKLSQKHPELVERTIIAGRDLKKANICVSYSNIAEDGNAGKVVATVVISRPDGSTEKMKLVGGVKDNTFLRCKQASAKIAEGSIVDFFVELKNMDRLANDGDVIGYADITAAISTSGEPLFREPPPPPPKPDPAPPAPISTPTTPSTPSTPSTPPATGGGGISAADEAAVVRLFNSKGVQLQRPKNNSPGKFLAVGPKTTTIPGSGHIVDPKTTGVGSTIAAAVADYEKKHKTNFPGGGTVNSTVKSLLAWYCTIKTAGGSTSIRKDQTGKYNAEYYRPWTGTQHQKKLSTLQAALDWLKKQGL